MFRHFGKIQMNNSLKRSVRSSWQWVCFFNFTFNQQLKKMKTVRLFSKSDSNIVISISLLQDGDCFWQYPISLNLLLKTELLETCFSHPRWLLWPIGPHETLHQLIWPLRHLHAGPQWWVGSRSPGPAVKGNVWLCGMLWFTQIRGAIRKRGTSRVAFSIHQVWFMIPASSFNHSWFWQVFLCSPPCWDGSHPFPAARLMLWDIFMRCGCLYCGYADGSSEHWFRAVTPSTAPLHPHVCLDTPPPTPPSSLPTHNQSTWVHHMHWPLCICWQKQTQARILPGFQFC